jgi:hypothetical protein
VVIKRPDLVSEQPGAHHLARIADAIAIWDRDGDDSKFNPLLNKSLLATLALSVI